LEGSLVQVYPYDGTQSRVRRVRINVFGESSAELFANVEIEAASQPLLSVPVDAVMTTGLHRYVFVKKSEENFVPTEITLGVQGDNELQVTNGLSKGETVVEGANFMVDADSKLEANFAAIDAENGK
jgi:Cu(I)/Ag(I) efflux system membrane fusion protein